MDLSGVGQMLGAVPGGFQQGQIANNQIDQGQLQIANERAKQAGMQAYFRALQGMMGGGGQSPQPPMPGQPSMAPHGMPGPSMGSPAPQQPPMPQSPMPPAAPAGGAMQTGGAAAPSPAGAPSPAPAGQMPQQSQMSWQGIVQALKQQNPAASDLELAHAVDHFMPMMTMQNQAEWRNIRSEVMEKIAGVRAGAQTESAGIRAGGQVEAAGVRAGGTVDAATIRAQEAAAARAQRDAQFQQREERLTQALGLRTDSTWQRLDLQKQALQARIAAGDKTRAVTEWRAAVDAQHKMAMEKIQATSTMNTMKPGDREKLLKDQNEWYRGEIEKLRNLTTQRGNVSDEPQAGPAKVENVPAGQPLPGAKPAAPAASAAPTAPQPGDVLEGHRFKGGDPANPQSWEKVNG